MEIALQLLNFEINQNVDEKTGHHDHAIEYLSWGFDPEESEVYMCQSYLEHFHFHLQRQCR